VLTDAIPVFRIANALETRSLSSAPPAGLPAAETAFSIEHEGLLVDLGPLSVDARAAQVDIAFRKPGSAAPPPGVTVTAALSVDPAKGLKLSITSETHLGTAGTFMLDLAPGAVARVRLVVSGREPAESGTKPYAPAGDVSVRVWIERRDTADTLERPEERRWITVNCIPLIAQPDQAILPGTPLTAQISGTDLPPPPVCVRSACRPSRPRCGASSPRRCPRSG